MKARRLTSTVLTTLCALAGGLLLSGVPAQAAVVHEYLTSIAEEVPAVGPHNEPVPSPGPLQRAEGIAVDSGELYVVDQPDHEHTSRLDVFDASTGAFLRQFPDLELGSSLYYFHQSVAVRHATGETEVYDAGDEHQVGGAAGRVVVTDAAGNTQGTWTGEDTPSKGFGCFQCSASGGTVAVDNSAGLDAGDVYVADEQHEVVDVFKPLKGGGEEYLTQITGPEPELHPEVHFSDTLKVAVSSFNGDVLVSDKRVVYVFEPTLLGTYTLVQQITSTPQGAFSADVAHMTVDSGNGEIYIALQVQQGIYQYDSKGNYLGRIIETPRGKLAGESGVAVDPATHDLYISDRKEETPTKPASDVVDVFGPDIVIPDVASLPASGVTPLSATLNGTVNPDEAGEATCRFEWGTTPEFGNVAPCEPEGVPNGGSPVAVHAMVSVQPDTTYFYRLQATNKADGHTNPGEAFQDQEFLTPGPGLQGESVSNVASTSATFDAKINPHNVPASYYFQYGTSASYGTDVPVLPGAQVGSGEGGLVVEQHVQGLLAGTAYHYRVVVVSEPKPGVIETFDEPDKTFTTQPIGSPFALLDDRQWEMVSPPHKNGALLPPLTGNGLIVSAGSGEALTYAANTPTEEGAKGYTGKVQEFAVRRAGGWEGQTITIPHIKATGPSIGEGPEYRLFSNDLSVAATQPFGGFNPALSVEGSESTAYLHTDFVNGDVNEPCLESCFRPLVTGKAGYANVPPGIVFGEESNCIPFCGPYFVGSTPDLRHMVLHSNVGLTEGTSGGLYEWGGGKLTFVGAATTLGNQDTQGDKHAISNDGSRVVFWTESKGLFMRDTVTGSLLRLDTVQGGSSRGQERFAFQGASSDGSKVFFTDRQRLTADAGVVGVGSDLYECEIYEEAGNLKCKLSDLTPIGAGEAHAEVRSVVNESEDGSWVYFAAKGSLGTNATPGKINLYVLHNNGTEWEKPKLISAIAPEDVGGEGSELSDITARVSPNGEWLTFMSAERLTGYDNLDAHTEQPDAEVYLYDARAGRLVCASCDPTGSRPVGVQASVLTEGLVRTVRNQSDEWIAASLPGWQQLIFGLTEDYQSRYLEDSGRLFFDSNEALVPQDVNGTEDVYEYEPPGVGSCTTSSATFSARSGGCVDLVSSGTSAEESAFLDASESGGDVFFLTQAKLTPQDFDTSLDIYDAHECTTAVPCFPAAPGVPPPCSTGDACKPSPSPQPAIFGAPSSATFSGAGNITPSGAPTAGGTPQGKPKTQTQAQKLKRALKGCHRKRGRGPRAVCERKARARYAAKRSRKANTTSGKRG